MTPTEILEMLYAKVIELINTNKIPKYPKVLLASVDTLIEKIDKNKSLVSALITSFIEKITNPNQDIRYHRTDFEQGYSARIFDANGIRYSLKYYLRFIDDYKDFIKSYTKHLIEDAKNSTEVQEFHIAAWRDILREHRLDG